MNKEVKSRFKTFCSAYVLDFVPDDFFFTKCCELISLSGYRFDSHPSRMFFNEEEKDKIKILYSAWDMNFMTDEMFRDKLVVDFMKPLFGEGGIKGPYTYAKLPERPADRAFLISSRTSPPKIDEEFHNLIHIFLMQRKQDDVNFPHNKYSYKENVNFYEQNDVPKEITNQLKIFDNARLVNQHVPFVKHERKSENDLHAILDSPSCKIINLISYTATDNQNITNLLYIKVEVDDNINEHDIFNEIFILTGQKEWCVIVKLHQIIQIHCNYFQYNRLCCKPFAGFHLTLPDTQNDKINSLCLIESAEIWFKYLTNPSNGDC